MNKILFAASECVPFIKTGGLADVVGALPKQFDKNYWDIRVVIPFYKCIKWELRQKCEYVTHFYMSAGSYIRNKYVGVMTCVYEGIRFYFIDNEEYFGGDYPYGEIYLDVEKFTFFDKAVLSILPVINFKPDVIHCNDWQTGFIPVYLKTEFQADMFFWGMKSLMTVHNLKFQGARDVKSVMGYTGFASYLFTPDKLECNKDANMLKAGLVYADYITTVSGTYANEIQGWEQGEGLDGLFRARRFDMQGIINGIDTELYNPETDTKIKRTYNIETFRKKKVANKEALQAELSLPVDKKKFMIGMVSRLTEQKGCDLVGYVIDRIVDENTQFVVLGTGDYKYEEMFRYNMGRFPDRVFVSTSYSDELSRKIYAASDAFLMPSKFEPCGLSQLMAMRYGAVPIVRATGGLADTVEAYNEFEHTGTGFSFNRYNGEDMLGIINYAKHIYYDKKRDWNSIAERAMRCDYSWKRPAARYENIYNYLINK